MVTPTCPALWSKWDAEHWNLVGKWGRDWPWVGEGKSVNLVIQNNIMDEGAFLLIDLALSSSILSFTGRPAWDPSDNQGNKLVEEGTTAWTCLTPPVPVIPLSYINKVGSCSFTVCWRVSILTISPSPCRLLLDKQNPKSRFLEIFEEDQRSKDLLHEHSSTHDTIGCDPYI